MNKRITFVIVMYKSEHVIKKCLSYLKNYPVIIVDNSQNINLKKLLITKFKNIRKYLIPKKNLGFSAGNNLGAKHVETEFIYFLSPDIFFIEDQLSTILEEFYLDNTLGIGTPILMDKSKKILKNCMKFPNLYKNSNITISHNSRQCDWVWGCSIIIKNDIFKKCKGFDERFFIYYSDVDLCKKLSLLNLKIKIFENFKIIHLVGKSSLISVYESSFLQISHKLAFYIYLSKYKKLNLPILLLDFFDYSQRMIKNLILLRFYKSYKNFLRLISIFTFLFYLKRYF